MSTEIDSFVAAFEANAERADTVTCGLSNGQFNWRSEPGRWSIAQALSHLNVVNGQDLAPLQMGVEQGRSRNLIGEGPFRYGLLSRKFVESMEPPVTRKFKASKYYEPPAEAGLIETMDEYRRISGELCRLARASAGLDLAGVRVKLPTLPPILRDLVSMPLGARFELIAAHDRRHLWQAEQIRDHPNFPKT